MPRYCRKLRVQSREHILDRRLLETRQRPTFTALGACDAIIDGRLGSPVRCRISRIEEVRQVDRIHERRHLRNVGAMVTQRGQRKVVFQLDPAQLGGR